MNSRFDKHKLAALCRKHGILLLILHGSHARGHAGRESDIDVGILSERKNDSAMRLKVIEDFGEILGEKFDPVFLNGAEPLISYQVAIHGKPLFEGQRGAFARFRLQALSGYIDTQKFRRLEKRYVKRAVGKE